VENCTATLPRCLSTALRKCDYSSRDIAFVCIVVYDNVITLASTRNEDRQPYDPDYVQDICRCLALETSKTPPKHRASGHLYWIIASRAKQRVHTSDAMFEFNIVYYHFLFILSIKNTGFVLGEYMLWRVTLKITHSGCSIRQSGQHHIPNGTCRPSTHFPDIEE
jgi:hypothetical protein